MKSTEKAYLKKYILGARGNDCSEGNRYCCYATLLDNYEVCEHCIFSELFTIEEFFDQDCFDTDCDYGTCERYFNLGAM